MDRYVDRRTTTPRRRRRSRSRSILPVVLIVIALVAAAGFGLFRLFMEDLRYSKKRTDLTQYLGITAQDDAAIILNHELLTEYAKLQNGRPRTLRKKNAPPP